MSDDTFLPFDLPGVSRKKVSANFDGGAISSDGGLLLLREADRHLGLTRMLASSAQDRRDPSRISDGTARMTAMMADVFCKSFRKRPAAITLDIDDTCDPLHGGQQLSLFNAHYDTHCFLPIHIYDVSSGKPVVVFLRQGKTPSGKEVALVLKHLVRRIAKHWPTTRITFRDDSHCGRSEAMAWCEANGIDYIFGLAGNSVLHRQVYEAGDAFKVAVRARRGQAARLHGNPLCGSKLDSRAEAHLSDASKKIGDLDKELGVAQDWNSKLQTDLDAERKAHESTKKEVERISKLVSKVYALFVKELGGKEGIQVVGDRFIIQSEVLFDSGSFELSAEGRTKVGKIAAVMKEIAPSIPADLKWGLQINGYTDIKKMKPGSAVKDNWELSTRRALTVLRLLEENGIASDRLAAAGYGENHPIATGSGPEDLKKNRRIELKLTD